VTTFEHLLEGWDGEWAVVRRDPESGGWIFVCIHSTRLGPAGGGTRMKVYTAPADGLADAMRLSGAMTAKLALAGLPLGGGKGVLAVPEIPDGDARRELLLRYGELVESLGGTYRTSSDVNTGEADMDVIAERTRHVFGCSVAKGGAGSPAPPTARGVYHGIRASVAHAVGADGLGGVRILIQGAGNVGSRLAEFAAADGAEVAVADVEDARAAAVAERVGGTVVAADAVYDTACDVYAPCALGGTIDAGTAPRLRCRIVAGSANNQLAAPEAAHLLAERGILYAPDYVINAGGAVGIVGLEQFGWTDDEVEVALVRIGETLREIYSRADDAGTTTATAADALVAARLAAGR
jgi:leucine dehydrogenase